MTEPTRTEKDQALLELLLKQSAELHDRLEMALSVTVQLDKELQRARLQIMAARKEAGSAQGVAHALEDENHLLAEEVLTLKTVIGSFVRAQPRQIYTVTDRDRAGAAGPLVWTKNGVSHVFFYAAVLPNTVLTDEPD